jgi:hypothetical protein
MKLPIARFYATLLVIAFIAWAPVDADAQGAINTGGAPVTIGSCGPILEPTAYATEPPSFMGIPIGSLTQTSAGMAISFVNASNKVATLVNFAVDSNGNHFVIRDVGTFSPGVTINHEYRNGGGQAFILPAFISPRVSCRVSSVEFADGTSWRKGQPPANDAAPVSRGLTATPAQVTLDGHSEAAIFMVQSSGNVAGLQQTNNCSGIAAVFVGTAGDTAVTYSVRPIAPGRCAAHVIDEYGHTVSIPITVN